MDILLVEDDQRMARLVQAALQDAGHRVALAGDGTAGLALAERAAYDTIVLDIMLPGMDGLAVCRRLRRQRRGTPILLLTARDAIADRVRGLDAGADDYLTKPFAVEELLARLRALDRRARSSSDDRILRVGDLSLDLTTRAARRGDRPLEQTSREFQLLAYLMRHDGRVLTREQISDEVWGYDANLSSNVVETYIHYLRDKVDHGFPHPLIRTIRGVGYTIRE